MKTKNFFAHLSAITVLAAVTTLFYGCGGPTPENPNEDIGGINEDFKSGELDGFEYVDLGLPSGTLWATTNANLDKTLHAYIGDFYAWGETEGHNGYFGYIIGNNGEKIWTGEGGGYPYKFTWENYKYSSLDENGHIVFSKYCQQQDRGLNGYTDTLTVWADEDMPTLSNNKKGWKVPTKAQWEELIANTHNEWYAAFPNDNAGYSRETNVATKVWKGWWFEGKNSKELFLPASGVFYSDSPFPGDSIIEFCESGTYWAREMHKEYGQTRAWAMTFDNYGQRIWMIDMPRWYGLSVRLVHDPL